MATALVAVAAVAAVSVFLASRTSAPQRATERPAAAHSQAQQSPQQAAQQTGQQTAQQQVDAAIAACRADWNAQTPALDAADRSLAQWQTHVAAMNALVAGKISYAQATQFWARTRVGAMHRVRVFHRADRALRQSDPTCATPNGIPVTGSAAATLNACVRGVDARDETLASASTAIATWRGHINEMEMLRNGQLSPSMATKMWIRSWHRGQRQLDDYRSLVSRASAQHC
jgi:hypothetical protein